LFTGLGVADGQQPQVGQLALQRVQQAHSHHVVPPGQLAQGLFPARFADEVRS
jgi:hypothetical protein